ncbi:hypothetical protein M9458_055210, partial [Cirrhinus mrigala]
MILKVERALVIHSSTYNPCRTLDSNPQPFIEEFLELANKLSWHDAALGVCFQLGLDHETHWDLPVC